MARPPPEQSIEDSDPRTPSSGPSTPRSPSAKIYASQSSPDRLKDVKTVRVLGDSSAPGERHEGATAIEDENLIEIRLKDLDSGKEFTILKVSPSFLPEASPLQTLDKQSSIWQESVTNVTNFSLL